MELIENYNKSITVCLIVLLFAIIIGGAYFIAWYGKEQTRLYNEYMRYYEKIQRVMTYEVCEQNYQWLCRIFYQLDNCKYKSPEMSEVLCNEFRIKFESIIEKRKNEVI